MKLPRADIHFHEDVRLLVWTPHGVLNESAIEHMLTLIGDMETSSRNPFNRFTDALAVEGVDLNFRYIFRVALFRRLSYAGRPPVKSAILVPNIALAHYSRLFELLTRGSSIKVRIFEEREAAAQWLGVPVELLTFSPIGSSE
jgi:hypothetical protein